MISVILSYRFLYMSAGQHTIYPPMTELKLGVLKSIKSALETFKEDLLQDPEVKDLILAGSSAANCLFTPNKKKLSKLQFFRQIENSSQKDLEMKGRVLCGQKITIKIFDRQERDGYSILPFQLLKGKLKDFPSLFSLNNEQVAISIKDMKVHYSLAFETFYATKQIKLITVQTPEHFIKRLAMLKAKPDHGYLNYHHEKRIALLFFFLQYKLNFKKNPDLHKDLQESLIELSKKIEPRKLKNIHCDPQDKLFIIRVALETSVKKTNRIFKIISQKRLTHLIQWCENDVNDMTNFLAKDIGQNLLKELGPLLHLPAVKSLYKNYRKKREGLYELLEGINVIYSKSMKDINITQNIINDFYKNFPNDTLKKIESKQVWESFFSAPEVVDAILPEGVFVRSLISINDLVLEGKRMKHCLGKMRKFSEIEKRYFFSLHYRGEYSTIEIQRNVKGAQKEPGPEDLLSEFERMLGNDPNGPMTPNRCKRDEKGYLLEVAPETHYIFSQKGKFNKTPSLAHQKIAKGLCHYLDNKVKKGQKEGLKDECNIKVA